MDALTKKLQTLVGNAEDAQATLADALKHKKAADALYERALDGYTRAAAELIAAVPDEAVRS